MAVRSAYYIGPVGAFEVVIPSLAYRKIVSVKREGTGHNIVSDPPGNRQVQYTAATGGFKFENAFTGTSTTMPLPVGFPIVNEKIFVIWEE
jgi:hypothetical protein